MYWFNNDVYFFLGSEDTFELKRFSSILKVVFCRPKVKIAEYFKI